MKDEEEGLNQELSEEALKQLEIEELRKEAENEIEQETRRRKKEAVKYRIRVIRDMEKAIERITKEIDDIQADLNWTKDSKTIYIGDLTGICIDLASDPESRG